MRPGCRAGRGQERKRSDLFLGPFQVLENQNNTRDTPGGSEIDAPQHSLKVIQHQSRHAPGWSCVVALDVGEGVLNRTSRARTGEVLALVPDVDRGDPPRDRARCVDVASAARINERSAVGDAARDGLQQRG
jgi:hypothetical protein